MKRFYLSLLTSLLFCSVIFAQQLPHFSLDMFNQSNLNPAYVGLDNDLRIKALVRSQWVGFAGSPQTQYITAEMPFAALRGGLGIQFENESIGAENGIKGLISYSYHLYIGKGRLSFGAAGGVFSRTLDGSKLLTPEGQYNEPGLFTHNDDILPTTKVSFIIPTFNTGIYYKGKKIEGGLSLFNINAGSRSENNVSLQLSRHFLLAVSTHFDLRGAFSLHPSLVVRSDFKETQTSLSVLLGYGENFSGGAAIRGYSANSLDALALIGQFKLSEKINMAYAYDIGLSALRTVHNGAHEIQLSYIMPTQIGKAKLPKIIYNPRFL